MRRSLLWLVVLGLVLVLAPSLALAQEGAGLTETFDDASLEGWEHGQDVLVADGVLRLAPYNPAFRIGSWNLASLRARARFTEAGGIGVIHYHATDQGSYNLLVASDQWTLERAYTGETEVLATGSAAGLDLTDWVDIEVTLTDGEHRVTAAGQEILTATEEDVLPPGAFGFVPTGEASLELDAVEFTPGPEGAPPLEGGSVVPPMEGEPAATPGEGAPPAEGEPAAAPSGERETTDTSAAEASGSGSLLGDFFSGQSNPTELKTFAINLALAAVCSFVLGLVYVFWGASLSNRRKFAANFIFITVTTTFIILVVRSSVALSLGLVGALSITRFRHAIKEPEELAYLFVAIGIGIGLGDNQRLITLLTLAVIVFIAAVMRFARRSQADVNLHLNMAIPAEHRVDVNEVMQLLRRHCSKLKLLRFDESSETTELAFVVEFRQTSDLNNVRAALKQVSPAVEISFLDNRGIW